MKETKLGVRLLLIALVALLPLAGLAQRKAKPLTEAEVLDLLRNYVPLARVAELARDKGIDFSLTAQVERRLRQAGADAALLKALRDLPPNLPTPAPPSPAARSSPHGPAPGTVRVNPKDGLKYVWIPGGTFMMGCSPGDSECTAGEKPSHRVTLSKGFWIGRTEVTVGGYKRFAGATGRQMPGAPNFNGGWANDNMPIVNVTWDDAHDYCKWAEGRLPTEAEWESAARGGSVEARYGNLDEIAWYSNNGGAQTHEVGQKRANGFGLYDTLGNVWEWVNDWYDQNYYQNSPSQDPPGPAGDSMRVLRGGSWYTLPSFVRVSNRGRLDPGLRRSYVGLRCAAEVLNP